LEEERIEKKKKEKERFEKSNRNGRFGPAAKRRKRNWAKPNGPSNCYSHPSQSQGPNSIVMYTIKAQLPSPIQIGLPKIQSPTEMGPRHIQKYSFA
jgi:hypothetical protein